MAKSNAKALNVRPAQNGDAAEIIRLIGEVWAEYGCVLDTSVEEKYLLSPATYFHARDGEFWVVQDGDTIIATGAVTMNDEATAELKSLYVDKDYRGRGLGEELTNMAIAIAREREAREMVLWSDTRFVHAHRLYERMGFTRNGARRLDDINHTTEFRFTMPLA